MKIVINKFDRNTLALGVLFLTFCEFLYTEVSGDKSKYVLILLCMVGLFYLILNHYRFVKYDMWEFALAIYILMYTQSSESIRYFLLVLCLITWSKMNYQNLDYFVEILIILGTALSVLQWLGGAERVYGFFANSAPQMACVAFVCETYLLICISNEGWNLFKIAYIFFCLFVMFISGTRSVLAVGCVIFAGYMVLTFLNSYNIRSKKLLIIVMGAVVFLFLVFGFSTLYDILSSKMARTNQNDSSMTRTLIYKMLLGELKADPGMLLLGKRAGYVEKTLKIFLNKDFYFPAHQDFLLVTCEYGVMGLIVFFVSFLKRHQAWLYFILVFGVCSFHNILLTPMTMVLMVITMCDIERKNYHVLLKPNTNRNS